MPLSPLDGRYASRVSALEPITSEFGLMHFRTIVEARWLIFLAEEGVTPPLTSETKTALQQLETSFGPAEYQAIKAIEKTTNHDVKAVEYFLREYVPKPHWAYIHWGCTSEDINNTAYAMMVTAARTVVMKEVEVVEKTLKDMSREWVEIPLLSLTHGQSATPTSLGKEMAVFAKRLETYAKKAAAIALPAKINGATGTFSAHVAAAPDHDWMDLSERFITQKLHLAHQPLTTQIEPHDASAELLMQMTLIANVLIDLSRDIWGYVSRGVFGQRTVAGEVGSSTMPHKVNPIDFENAEGNLKFMRGMAMTLATELPISRFQRDLTDSTLQRNYGVIFGHFLLSLKSLQKGLGKLTVRTDITEKELKNAPEVLTEAVQMAMRLEGEADAYDQLKAFSRGQKLNLKQVHDFIRQTNLLDPVKQRLLALTPSTYTGVVKGLLDRYL